MSDFIHIYDNNSTCVRHVVFILLGRFSLMDIWVAYLLGPYFSYYEYTKINVSVIQRVPMHV